MDRTQKRAFVEGFNGSIGKANTVVVAHYRGLTVKQMQTLRRNLREQGGEAQVAKNRLAKLALKGTRFEGLSDLLVGPTIIAFSEDVIAAAKVTQKFADDNNVMVVLGGQMEDKVLDAAGVKTIASLPSLNELRGKLVGLLQAPGGQIARVLKAYADKGGASAEASAPAAAPAAEASAPAEAAPAAEAPAAPAEEAAAAPAETTNA